MRDDQSNIHHHSSSKPVFLTSGCDVMLCTTRKSAEIMHGKQFTALSSRCSGIRAPCRRLSNVPIRILHCSTTILRIMQKSVTQESITTSDPHNSFNAVFTLSSARVQSGKFASRSFKIKPQVGIITKLQHGVHLDTASVIEIQIRLRKLPDRYVHIMLCAGSARSYWYLRPTVQMPSLE